MNGCARRLIDTPEAKRASISLASPSRATMMKMATKKDAGSDRPR